jgi:hypothetical protein
VGGLLRHKQENQNGGSSSGDGGMLVDIIYTTQILADFWGLSGSAKSGETKHTIIQAEQR